MGTTSPFLGGDPASTVLVITAVVIRQQVGEVERMYDRTTRRRQRLDD